jgi:hypothetical protein
MNRTRTSKRAGISAWLVTWEGVGPRAQVGGRIAAILNPSLSGRRVAEIVELLYANASYTLSERLDCAKDRKNNPYRVQLGTLNGVPWEGQMICGHNPFLEARLVDNLRTEQDAVRRGTLVQTQIFIDNGLGKV